MKLINPGYKIITDIKGETILKEMEIAARTCYKSEGNIEYGRSYLDNNGIFRSEPNYAKSARVLMAKIIKRKHWPMLEFGGTIHVLFTNDRGVSHEEVRHRIASFAQESTRYVNYSPDGKGECQFIKIEQHLKNPDVSLKIWFNHMIACEVAYNDMIAAGESPQIARSVLPNSTKTEINICCNIREWRHIFTMRTPNSAHPQIREVMQPLLDEFKKRIPLLFDDITYEN